MMLPILYMDTGRHTQMHSQTQSHIYTPPAMTERPTDTWTPTADTYKHAHRHIKKCIASQTQAHTDTYKHTYKQTHKRIDAQTTHGFIIFRPSEQGSDQGPKRVQRGLCI